jgi:O-antigen/teichoic acid export membrane protein
MSSTYKFVAGNFLGTIFGILPSTLVPIIVLNRLGPSPAAYFYIVIQFAGFLSIVCSSSAQSFLAEASDEKELTGFRSQLFKASKNLYSLLVPAAIIMAVIGTQMLRLYGYNYYKYGALPLVIFSISSLFIAINWLGDSLLNVQKRPFAYGLMNFLNAFLVIILIYIFAKGGLLYVSLGWLAAQLLTVIIYFLLQYNYLKTTGPAVI